MGRHWRQAVAACAGGGTRLDSSAADDSARRAMVYAGDAATVLRRYCGAVAAAAQLLSLFISKDIAFCPGSRVYSACIVTVLCFLLPLNRAQRRAAPAPHLPPPKPRCRRRRCRQHRTHHRRCCRVIASPPPLLALLPTHSGVFHLHWWPYMNIKNDCIRIYIQNIISSINKYCSCALKSQNNLLS